MQEEDYKWFVAHYKKLYEQYGSKYISIKNQNVLGTYSTYAEAVRETSQKEEIGSFIVQYCNGNESAYTNYISSLELVFD